MKDLMARWEIKLEFDNEDLTDKEIEDLSNDLPDEEDIAEIIGQLVESRYDVIVTSNTGSGKATGKL